MTQPQWSPDRQWWWDGTQWVPAAQAPPEAQAPAPVEGQPPWSQPGQQAQGGQPPWPQGQTGTPQWQQSPYGQQPPYGQVPYATAPPSGTDGKAVTSLVLGVLWLGGLGSIAAVIFGHLSRSQAKKEQRSPSGLALAGLILGYLGIAGTIFVVAIAAIFSDEIVEGVDAGVELQSAADAEHSYHDANGRFTANLGELDDHGYVNIRGETRVRVIRATATSFCLSASLFGETEYMDEGDDRPSSTPCG